MLPLDNASSNQSAPPIMDATHTPDTDCSSIETPTVHLDETDRRYTVTVMVAGARADDLTVTVQDNVVHIARDTPQHSKQSVQLPQPIDADATHAVLNGNILTLHLPKQPTDTALCHIPVTTTAPTIETVTVS